MVIKHEQVPRNTDPGSSSNALSIGLNKSQNIRNEIIMLSHVICFRVKWETTIIEGMSLGCFHAQDHIKSVAD